MENRLQTGIFRSIISEASTTAIGFESLISVPCRDWKIMVLLA